MGKPMPEEIREALRSSKHPALAVSCDHCDAKPSQRCRLRLRGRLLDMPHPSRVDKAAGL